MSAFGGHILPIVDVEPIHNVLTQGRRAKNSRTRTVANWATKEIRKLQNAAKGVTGGTATNPQFAGVAAAAAGNSTSSGSMNS